MRVLVCGGRHYQDREWLFGYLDILHSKEQITTVIEGGATGADTLAREWANTNGVPVKTFPVDWEQYGRAAGPIRNHQMLKEGDPELVVAFFELAPTNSRGTFNMVKQAKRAGIEVRIASGMTQYMEMSSRDMRRTG